MLTTCACGSGDGMHSQRASCKQERKTQWAGMQRMVGRQAGRDGSSSGEAWWREESAAGTGSHTGWPPVSTFQQHQGSANPPGSPWGRAARRPRQSAPWAAPPATRSRRAGTSTCTESRAACVKIMPACKQTQCLYQGVSQACVAPQQADARHLTACVQLGSRELHARQASLHGRSKRPHHTAAQQQHSTAAAQRRTSTA